MKSNVIQSSKDILGGTPTFPGTRVAIQTLIDYLEGGDTVNDFLLDFPSVNRKQVMLVLEYVKTTLLAK